VRGIGLYQLIGQPEPLAEFKPPRNGGNEIIGASLHFEAVFVDGG
jgi:hypothetical protein